MALVNVGGKINLAESAANIDNKYGPYASVQEAYDILGPDNLDVLAIGLTVGIQATPTSPIEEYWFKEACESVEDLVPKIVGGSGTTDYEDLENKPSINQVELTGDKPLSELGIQGKLTAGDGITLNNNTISYDAEVISSVEYVDANITDTMNFIIQERNTEHAGRVAGDELLGAKIDRLEVSKQDALVSGTNIKTINNTSILGSGNIEIHGGEGVEVDNESITFREDDAIQAIGVIDQNTETADKIWSGTQAEYDALEEIDEDTFYAITDAEMQEKLVSGENIKTINNQNILGAGEIVLEADNIPAEGNQTVQENLDYLQNTMPFSTEEKTVIGNNVHIADNHSSEIKNLKVYGSEEGLRTINVGKSSDTPTTTITLDNIEDTVDNTISGKEIILEDLNSPVLKNLKIYGKSGFDPHPWKLENVVYCGVPGWITDGKFTDQAGSSTGHLQNFFITNMKVPVVGGDEYVISGLPRSGGTAGIHWFTNEYTGIIPVLGADQPAWIKKDTFTDGNEHRLVAPENAAYLEVMGSISTADIPITTDKVKAMCVSSNFTLTHMRTINLFDIDALDLGDEPYYGYLSDTGVYTKYKSGTTPWPNVGLTNMKIPVTAGQEYIITGLEMSAGNNGAIQWFDSSYTKIDKTNTTTTQTGFLSRTKFTASSTGVYTGTVTAPANAAYAEIQFIIREMTEVTFDGVKEGLKDFVFGHTDSGTDIPGTYGTIYISDSTIGEATQEVDLSSIEDATDATYITKVEGEWVTVNGEETEELPDSLQSQLNGLTLYEGTSRLWNENQKNIEVAFSSNVVIDFDTITSDDYIAKIDNVWSAHIGQTTAPLSTDNALALDALGFLGHKTYFWTNSGSNVEITYLRDYMTLPTAKKQIKILLLSNSFGQDSFSYVPYLVDQITNGEVNIKIGLLYIGGCSLSHHWRVISGDSASYTYYEAEGNGAWKSYPSYKAIDALKKEDWDLFAFNHLSPETAMDGFDSYSKLKEILQWVFDNTTHRVKIAMFYGSPYDKTGTTEGGVTYDLDTDEMFELEIPVLKEVMEKYPIEFFMANGTAIQNARTNPTLNALGNHGKLLYDIHAQEGIPCLIEAYTSILGIFDAFDLKQYSIFGDKPTYITDAWINSMAIPGKHGSVVGMTNSNILLAQKCAMMAHKNNYEVATID